MKWDKMPGSLRRKKELAKRAQVRSHKYGVAPKEERTRLGVLYDSKLEAKYAEQLDLLRHALRTHDRVAEVRRQVSVPLEVNGALICRYRCDFEVIYADGRVEWHEVKGYDTPEWRIKEKLVRALYPGQTLKVIRKV